MTSVIKILKILTMLIVVGFISSCGNGLTPTADEGATPPVNSGGTDSTNTGTVDTSTGTVDVPTIPIPIADYINSDGDTAGNSDSIKLNISIPQVIGTSSMFEGVSFFINLLNANRTLISSVNVTNKRMIELEVKVGNRYFLVGEIGHNNTPLFRAESSVDVTSDLITSGALSLAFRFSEVDPANKVTINSSDCSISFNRSCQFGYETIGFSADSLTWSATQGTITEANGVLTYTAPKTGSPETIISAQFLKVLATATLSLSPEFNPIIITASANQTKSFDAEDPILSYSVTGLLGSDTVTASVTRTPGTDVGIYRTFVIQNPVDYPLYPLDNTYYYSASFVDGTFTITKIVQDFKFASDTYTVTEGQFITNTVTGINSVNNINTPGTIIYSAGNHPAVANINPITGTVLANFLDNGVSSATVTISAFNGGNNNYDPRTTTYTLIINEKERRTLTFSTLISAVTYGDTATYNVEATLSTGTGTIAYNSSVRNVASISNINTTTGNITIGNAGTTIITASNTNPFYQDTAVSYTLTVNPKPITIIANPTSKVYGIVDDPMLTYTIASDTPLVGNDTLTGTITRTAGVDVGTYTITSDLRNSNYNISFDGDDKFNITRRPITVIANANGKQFANPPNPDPALTYTIASDTPLVGNDTLMGAITRTAGEGTGTYTITQGTLNNLNNPNYNITFRTRAFTISEQQQQTSFVFNEGDITKTYGDSTFTEAVTTPGSSTNTVITYSSSDTNIATVNGSGGVTIKAAGETTISAKQEGNNDYADISKEYTLIVEPKPITITAEDKDRDYLATNPIELTYTNTALVGNDNLSGALTTTATTNSNAGNYPITIGALTIIQGTTLDINNNYAITFVAGTLTINKITLPFSAGADTTTFTNDTFNASTNITDISSFTGSGTITYTISNSNSSATIDEETGEIMTSATAGIATVQVDVSEGLNYLAASDSFTIAIILPAMITGINSFVAQDIEGDTGQSEDVITLDANGDGAMDIYVMSSSSSNKLWLNNNDGSGSFTAGVIVDDSSSNGAVALDADGDGDVDIYVARNGQNQLLLNNGSGTFTITTLEGELNTDRSENAIALDVDEDGDMDIYVVNATSDSIDDISGQNRLWINNNEGTFTLMNIAGDNGNGLDAVVLDVNDDGSMDIYVANDGQNYWIPILISTNDNSLITPNNPVRLLQESNKSYGVTTLDFNNDGRTDIYVANDGPNRLWINGGDNFSKRELTIHQTNGSNSQDAITLDANGDGLDDIYVVNDIGDSTTQNLLLINSLINGISDFKQEEIITIGDDDSNDSSAVVLDANGDGAIDIYVASSGSDSQNKLWINNTGSIFNTETPTIQVQFENARMDSVLNLYSGLNPPTVISRLTLTEDQADSNQAKLTIGGNNGASVLDGTHIISATIDNDDTRAHTATITIDTVSPEVLIVGTTTALVDGMIIDVLTSNIPVSGESILGKVIEFEEVEAQDKVKYKLTGTARHKFSLKKDGILKYKKVEYISIGDTVMVTITDNAHNTITIIINII